MIAHWAHELLACSAGFSLASHVGQARKAVDYGDQCWSKVLMNWENWRQEGRTQHRNWWPELYTVACQSWNIEPDPAVLAYDTSYQSVRADLKNLSTSG